MATTVSLDVERIEEDGEFWERFSSRPRVLAKWFHKSRENWKRKCQMIRREFKRLQVQVADVRKSREGWRQKAEYHECELAKMVAEVERLRRQVEPSEKKETSSDVMQVISSAGGCSPLSLGGERTTRKGSEFAPVDEESLPGQHYSLSMVSRFCRLVLEARTSLQCAPRVLSILLGDRAGGADGGADDIPHATSGRWWLLRLGYYKLHRRLERADDWVWLADHTVQIGQEKCLAIAGVRLAHLPPAGECLALEHLEPIAVLPVQSSTQEVVQEQLEEVAKEAGVPRAIVSDEGGDLVGGVRGFRQRHESVAWVSDMPHKAARLLKRRLTRDPHWSSFCTRTAQSKSQMGQTELAFLVPPRQRSKARYMNLGPLLRWAERTLGIVDGPPPKVLEYCTSERIEEKLGWLRDYRDDLERWSRWQTLVERANELVRREGYSSKTASRLPDQLSPLIESDEDQSLRDELVEFVREQSEKTVAGERLPGSTEVLESSFGKLKSMEGQPQQGGFTGLILVWAALLGVTTKKLVAQALTSTPTKRVQHWITEKLGPTLQSKRRTTYHALTGRALQKPEDT